jgi:hypothetical protein
MLVIGTRDTQTPRISAVKETARAALARFMIIALPPNGSRPEPNVRRPMSRPTMQFRHKVAEGEEEIAGATGQIRRYI